MKYLDLYLSVVVPFLYMHIFYYTSFVISDKPRVLLMVKSMTETHMMCLTMYGISTIIATIKAMFSDIIIMCTITKDVYEEKKTKPKNYLRHCIAVTNYFSSVLYKSSTLDASVHVF
jgi:hypothetical protein